MRLSRILILIAAFSLPVALPAAAQQGRGGGKPAGVGKPTTTTTKAPKAQAPKPTDTATHGKSGSEHGKSADVHGQSADLHGKSGDEHGKSTDARGTNGSKKETDTDTTTTTAGSANGRGQLAIDERIAQNPQLKQRLETMLTGSGLTLKQAADGFSNQGQFISAVEASKNNNISFTALKTELLTNKLSLNDAVQKVKGTTTATP